MEFVQTRDRKEVPENWVIVDALADIILRNVKGCVVDIGMGASTFVLRKHSKKHGRKHYSCDPNQRICDWAGQWGSTVFKGRSFDFMKQFDRSQKIALMFVDGAHIYEIVMEEVKFFLEQTTKGGVIFLHDTYPPEKWVCDKGKRGCGSVYKARQELEKRNDIQIYTFIYTAFDCGLTMITKKEDNPIFCRS